MCKLTLSCISLFFLISCGDSNTKTTEEPANNSNIPTETTTTPEPAISNNLISIEGVANILYQQFLFGKEMVSSFRKSDQLFTKQDDDSYKLNEDYQSTLEKEDEETFTTAPLIVKKTAKGINITDVSYNCKNCPETEDVYMAFSYLDEHTVLLLLSNTTTGYDDGYEADTDFQARVFRKQGDIWIDVSAEALPNNLKDIFFQFFEENHPSDYIGNGIYSLDCADCLEIVLNDDNSIQLEAPESTKDGSNFIFLYEEGKLFIP